MSDKRSLETLAAGIARAVEARLGGGRGDLSRLIAEELAGVLGDVEGATGPGGSMGSAGSTGSTGSTASRAASRVVVTAHGRNRTGIVARLAAAIDELSGDIRDLSQTIVGDYFTMLFVVDVPGAEADGARFAQLRQRLTQVGGDLGVHVVVMHDDILTAMHTI